jgi:hypothetical protein
MTPYSPPDRIPVRRRRAIRSLGALATAAAGTTVLGATRPQGAEAAQLVGTSNNGNIPSGAAVVGTHE